MGLDRGYSYHGQMVSLRTMLRKCRGQAMKAPDRNTVLSLIIPLSKFLKARGITEKSNQDQVRYKILSLLMKRDIGSTNDLTSCECATIANFFFEGGQGLTSEAFHFLKDLTAKAQEAGIHSEN